MMEEISKKEREYFSLCGIGDKYIQKSLDDFTNDSKAKQTVKKFLVNIDNAISDGIGLYLWGANGVGKTHLLSCSFKELIIKKYKVRIYSMDEIVNRYTASWYSDEQRESFYKELRTIDILGIDEFGKNVDNLPELVKRAVEAIIRYRTQNKKPIWVTSNTEPSKVTSVFSEDVASLLREACITVKVVGPDFRGKISNRNKEKYL